MPGINHLQEMAALALDKMSGLCGAAMDKMSNQSVASGSHTVNVLPFPIALSAVMRPLCRSISV